MLAAAGWAYRTAQRFDAKDVAAPSRNVPTGSLPVTPGPREGWRPAITWLRLPDPLPGTGVLHPTIVPPFLHKGPMPPDETLRRLWVVRAELACYRWGARYMSPQLAMIGFTVCLCLVIIFT